MKPLRSLTKRALKVTGAGALVRRLRHSDTLTVVLFHRVLPPEDPRAAAADPDFTVSLETLEAFAHFAARAYDVISLQDLEAAVLRRRKLPPRAMLITFDDAWEDTARYAVPALAARSLPSAIFVPTGALGNDLVLWRDTATVLWRASMLDDAAALRVGQAGIKSLLAWLEAMPEAERDARLTAGLARSGERAAPLMMTPAQLHALPKSVSFGAHGVKHLSFTSLASAEGELVGGREGVRALTGTFPPSLAFPFGHYEPRHVQAAWDADYSLVFTLDRCVNALELGRPRSPVFGRVMISENDVRDAKGTLRPELLECWLAFQPIVALDRYRGSFPVARTA